MRYQVLALDSLANEHRLVIEAPDSATARRDLVQRGLSVMHLQTERVSASARTRSFNLDLFCQELLAMLQAGVNVREALQTLAAKEVATGATTLARLVRGVDEGQPLSEVMARHSGDFPVLLTESMRAAERTSDYVPALTRFVQYRQLAAQMRGKLVAAALYPLILLGVSLCVLLFLVGYVVPRFASVYEDLGDRMPPASRVLMVVGQVVGGHPGWTLAAAVALVLVLVLAWRAGAIQSVLLWVVGRVPQLRRILDTVELTRLYRTLALLLSGGMPLVASLELAAGVLPPSTALRVRQVRQRISEGHAFSDSFEHERLSTPVADRFFRVGERTGRLADMIDRAADFHEDEVSRAADWLGRVIGPVMMLVMGVLIGVVVVLMYLPIFQLSEALQ